MNKLPKGPTTLWARSQPTNTIKELLEKTDAAYRTVRFSDPETAKLLLRDADDLRDVLKEREGIQLADNLADANRPIEDRKILLLSLASAITSTTILIILYIIWQMT